MLGFAHQHAEFLIHRLDGGRRSIRGTASTESPNRGSVERSLHTDRPTINFVESAAHFAERLELLLILAHQIWRLGRVDGFSGGTFLGGFLNGRVPFAAGLGEFSLGGFQRSPMPTFTLLLFLQLHRVKFAGHGHALLFNLREA